MSIEQHGFGSSALWLRSLLSDPQGEQGWLEQQFYLPVIWMGWLSVSTERETGLRGTKKLNHGPLEARPGGVTYLLTSRPVFLPTDTGFPLLLKVLLFTSLLYPFLSRVQLWAFLFKDPISPLAWACRGAYAPGCMDLPRIIALHSSFMDMPLSCSQAPWLVSSRGIKYITFMDTLVCMELWSVGH